MNEIYLLSAAFLFAFITGANDGASLISLNLNLRVFKPMIASLILVAAIIFIPALLGTAVATTFALGLTKFSQTGGSSALFCAVLVTVGLILLFARLHIPTSVTQALTGAIIGIGLGRGLTVDGTTALRVIAILIIAPVVAFAFSILLGLFLQHLHHRLSNRMYLKSLWTSSFLLQCLAYATNDAQKMIAVFIISAGLLGTSGHVEIVPQIQLAIAVAFLGGIFAGISGLGGRITKLLPIHALNATTAGFAASSVVLGSSLIGSPVSMAQAQAAALVGSEVVVSSYKRIRWGQVWRIISVWFTTLPSALVLAFIVGLATK